jgi:type IV secretory pathway TrbF-like protein
MRSVQDDTITAALAEFINNADVETDATLLDQSEVPRTTQYYRAKGRPTIEQYLTP